MYVSEVFLKEQIDPAKLEQVKAALKVLSGEKKSSNVPANDKNYKNLAKEIYDEVTALIDTDEERLNKYLNKIDTWEELVAVEDAYYILSNGDDMVTELEDGLEEEYYPEQLRHFTFLKDDYLERKSEVLNKLPIPEPKDPDQAYAILNTLHQVPFLRFILSPQEEESIKSVLRKKNLTTTDSKLEQQLDGMHGKELLYTAGKEDRWTYKQLLSGNFTPVRAGAAYDKIRQCLKIIASPEGETYLQYKDSTDIQSLKKVINVSKVIHQPIDNAVKTLDARNISRVYYSVLDYAIKQYIKAANIDTNTGQQVKLKESIRRYITTWMIKKYLPRGKQEEGRTFAKYGIKRLFNSIVEYEKWRQKSGYQGS